MLLDDKVSVGIFTLMQRQALASASTAGDKIVMSFVGANDYSITLSDKEAVGYILFLHSEFQ